MRRPHQLQIEEVLQPRCDQDDQEARPHRQDQADAPPGVRPGDDHQHPHRGEEERQGRRTGLGGEGIRAAVVAAGQQIRDEGAAAPVIRPDGTAYRITRRTKCGRARSVLGASARKKAGTPMVRVDSSVRCRGRIRVRNLPAGHQDRQQDRVDGLGEEQGGDAGDVADDPAALGDHRRQRREAVVEQHDLRDRAGGLGAGAHRHTDVRVLQRQHVVDAVAGHRDMCGRATAGHRPCPASAAG